MSSSAADPVDLEPSVASTLPPSGLLVYLALRETDGPRSTRSVARWTGISEKTTRRALQRLQEADVVEQRRSVEDARGVKYALIADGEQPG